MILADIQRKLSVPKSRWSEFGQYYYRNADDILSAAKRILPDGWVILATCKPVVVGEWVYQSCTVTLTDGKESYSAEGWAREVKEKAKFDASQLSGSAMSFAKKYALCNLLAIDDGQDPDTTKDLEAEIEEQEQRTEIEPKPKPKLNRERLAYAIALYCSATGISKEEFKDSEAWRSFTSAHPLETRTQEEQDAFAERLIEAVSEN